MSEAEPQKTPLYDFHVAHGARMVEFAGYAMPVQYAAGIVKEHLHTRAQAALFDVSHMGQAVLSGAPDGAYAEALEALVPADLKALGVNRTRYALLTNDNGGIIDDLMLTNCGDHWFAVVNASRKHVDIPHMQAVLGERVRLQPRPEWALLALQGPAAAAVMARLGPGAEALQFMQAGVFQVAGARCFVTRSGYTGEDGFELSLAGADAAKLAPRLVAEPEVEPAGLGARDSLRLEAGLCLYGHDIDEATTPVEAGLTWTVGRRRRAEGGFPGAAVIQRQIADGAPRRRVGVRPDGRAPARDHTEIQDVNGVAVGAVTSGGYGPSVGGPVAMGYVETAHARIDAPLRLIVRGKALPARVAKLPFVRHRYRVAN